jgi:hypothetical protein
VDKYVRIFQELQKLGIPDRLAILRHLCRTDRYFLLRYVCNRKDVENPWLYSRCQEVDSSPDDHLDLWAREHYKSTIITFAGTIQSILKNPEETIGLFSHTRPISKSFLRQIKRELETNEALKSYFPEILYTDPEKESPQWSEETGIVVKRQGNPKEATVEAWGLVDGMPTAKHFSLRIYDDIVTKESVSTPEQVMKTTEAWSLSDNLGTVGGRKWMIGTRYSYGDTYQVILDRKAVIPRIYPATDDGTVNGKPVFFPEYVWQEKLKTQLESDIACQMLQNPLAGKQAFFRKEWLNWYEIRPHTLNVYIMCDPASSKKAGSDSTAIAVVGVDAQSNKYLLDGYHHKMSLDERWDAMKFLYQKWNREPGVQTVQVGYEKYGMQSDIEHFEQMMKIEGFHFSIKELKWPRSGGGSKKDRVQRLEPDFKNENFFLPKEGEGLTSLQKKMKSSGEEYRIAKNIKHRDHNGRMYDLTQNFIVEYLIFPYGSHDDLIDAMSRLYDMDYTPAMLYDEVENEPKVYADGI